MTPPRAPLESAADTLPSPRGVRGHLRYSFAALRRRRRLRQALDLVDERLRVAVSRRDEALARLGQSALSERRDGGRVRAFHETLTRLDEELAAAQAARDAAVSEREAAEADRRDAVARFDGQAETLRVALEPVERRLERKRKDRTKVEERLNALARRRAAAEAELAAVGAEALDEAGEAAQAERRSRLKGRLDELSTQLSQAEAEREEARAPIVALSAERETLLAQLDELKADRANALESADEALALLAAEEAQADARLNRFQARRKAVLMDLGHEMLAAFPDDEGPAQQDAKAAFAHIQALRAERDTLDARREAVDLQPVWRTGVLAAATFVALLLLWRLL